jgi:hypothetical protein
LEAPEVNDSMCVLFFFFLLPLLSLCNIYMLSVCVSFGNKINGESFFYALECERVGEVAVHDFIKLK